MAAKMESGYAVSLLVDLETAQQEISVLLSDEPKTMEEWKEKKGFA
jgi:hypothetical protein